MWFYIHTEPGLWTVGFEDQKGKWHTDSDHESREEAASRCAYLNGGCQTNEVIKEILRRLQSIDEAVNSSC